MLPESEPLFAGFSRWIVAEIIQSRKSCLPEYMIESIFAGEDVVCSLDIRNLILIVSLAKGMTIQTQNREGNINDMSNSQSMGLSDILPNGYKSFCCRPCT